MKGKIGFIACLVVIIAIFQLSCDYFIDFEPPKVKIVSPVSGKKTFGSVEIAIIQAHLRPEYNMGLRRIWGATPLCVALQAIKRLYSVIKTENEKLHHQLRHVERCWRSNYGEFCSGWAVRNI